MKLYSPNDFNVTCAWRSTACSVASTFPRYISNRGNTLHCRLPQRNADLPRHDVKPGDVVSFQFPHLDSEDERLSGCFPDARPCLVAEIDPETDSALIVYGTARNTGANRGFEIWIKRDLDACGLNLPTRFIFSRRFRVSLNDPRFTVRAQGTPVTGRLPEVLMSRLERLHTLVSASYGGHEKLRHVHEWIGSNEVDDCDIVARLMCRGPQVAS